MTSNIRSMQANDWDAVKAIYLEGIATGHATFQTTAPSWEVWDKDHLKACRLVAEINNEVVGWAMLSSISSRCVYAGVAEVSVYVGEKAQGNGIGRALLSKLIAESETNNIWTLEAGIFPENTSSIRIHKRCGFREVGYREKLGKMDGKWRDVILLERRSSIAGQN